MIWVHGGTERGKEAHWLRFEVSVYFRFLVVGFWYLVSGVWFLFSLVTFFVFLLLFQ
ncbi:hypothetical protein BDZ91DRAFT_529322 [Kalaharituber pfeilii]|nr:hypothetical protein BDZ91DRAFT_529322 [Kalaharituber pfeilii]